MNEIFPPRLLRALLIVSVLSLFAGVFAAVFGDRKGNVDDAQANSYSYSAIGHRALYEVLRSAGFRVVRTRNSFRQSRSSKAFLLLLEPYSDDATRLRRRIESSEHCLIALPKREGVPDPSRSGWLTSTALVPQDESQDVLNAFDKRLRVARSRDEIAATWRRKPGLKLGADPVQLRISEAQVLARFSSDRVDAVLENKDGVLLARKQRGSSTRWLLADPDLLSNHGLAQEANASFIVDFMRKALPKGMPIFIDETMHGFGVERTLMNELGRAPLLYLFVQVLLVLAVFVWAGSRRFGAPIKPGEALGRGKQLIIDNTAELLAFGGHSKSTLQRFLALEEKRVAAAWHIACDSPNERRSRLRAIEERRDLDTCLDQLASRVRSHGATKDQAGLRIEDTARAIVRWRRGMLNG